MKYFLGFIILFIIMISIWQFVTFSYKKNQQFMYRSGISFELFYTLLVIYCIVIVGFGLLYFMLSFHTEVLVEIGQVPYQTVKDSLLRSIYFSGVTMMTIGYGDIIPMGIGRLLAVIQAMIGYILPTTFVLKLVHLNLEASHTMNQDKEKK